MSESVCKKAYIVVPNYAAALRETCEGAHVEYARGTSAVCEKIFKIESSHITTDVLRIYSKHVITTGPKKVFATVISKYRTCLILAF